MLYFLLCILVLVVIIRVLNLQWIYKRFAKEILPIIIVVLIYIFIYYIKSLSIDDAIVTISMIILLFLIIGLPIYLLVRRDRKNKE